MELDFISEISENTFMPLSEVQQRFVFRWGDMGTRWGIPRSTAMLHGLLYLSQRPLTAEEMCHLLKLARSNVSTSLRELEDFRLVYRESRPGDRRSYYTAETDVWEIARRILEERRRREMEGAVRAVEECLHSSQEVGDAHTVHRMEAMMELLQAADLFAATAQKYPTRVFRQAIQMGSKVLSWLSRL